MMAVRWLVFSLQTQITKAEQVHDVNPCPRCLQSLYLVNINLNMNCLHT